MLLTQPPATPVSTMTPNLQKGVTETINSSPVKSSLSLINNKSRTHQCRQNKFGEKKASKFSALMSTFFSMLLRRKWLILLTTLLISLIGIVTYLLMKPTNITISTVLMAGVLSGLFLGTLIASIREWRNSLLLSQQDLQEGTGYRVLGVIPENKRGQEHLAKVIVDKPYSRVAEAYRLAAMLMLHGEWRVSDSSYADVAENADHNHSLFLDDSPMFNTNSSSSFSENKVILITSVNAGEGKSVTASNFAFCLAELGSKILIVDGDLRKPSIHFKLGIQNKEGLINYLQNRQELPVITQHVDSMPGLFAITAGSSLKFSPINLLSNKRMVSFINSAKKYFDYVILDAPPIKGFADTLLLHSMANSTIVVVPEKNRRIRQINISLDMLEQVKPSILGLLKVRAKKDTVHKDYYKNYSRDSISERFLFNNSKKLNLGKNKANNQ